MNTLELRTMVHNALNQQAGTQYGQILTVEPIPPVAGDPALKLRVAAPAPSGDPRVYLITIAEE